MDKVRNLGVVTLAICVALAGTAAADTFEAGVAAGWNVGPGLDASGTFENFTRDVPLSARLTVGYHGVEAGDPYAARRVFINDNTNGDPEKSGSAWLFRFDLLLPAFRVGGHPVHAFAGPRHARHSASFNYVGGNENFDVTSNPWGLGVGVESRFAMGTTTAFFAQAGFDWYGKSKLEGHDTAYLPSGDDVNPRDGYTWTDADAAIGQPRWEILAMMGVRFRL
jgi:hypothetical protein